MRRGRAGAPLNRDEPTTPDETHSNDAPAADSNKRPNTTKPACNDDNEEEQEENKNKDKDKDEHKNTNPPEPLRLDTRRTRRRRARLEKKARRQGLSDVAIDAIRTSTNARPFLRLLVGQPDRVDWTKGDPTTMTLLDEGGEVDGLVSVEECQRAGVRIDTDATPGRLRAFNGTSTTAVGWATLELTAAAIDKATGHPAALPAYHSPPPAASSSIDHCRATACCLAHATNDDISRDATWNKAGADTPPPVVPGCCRTRTDKRMELAPIWTSCTMSSPNTLTPRKL